MDFLKILKPRKNKFSEELITQSVELDVENAIDDLPERNEDVISFRVDYLGQLQVDKIQNFNADDALKILKREKERNKIKTQRGVILISHNFIRLTDMRAKQVFRIPILRISSCSMDPFNKKVFFFISMNQNKRTYHAFLCEKWKNAYNAAQAIAHKFSHSHEIYVRDMQNRKFIGMESEKEITQKNEDQRYSIDMMDFSVDVNHTAVENCSSSKNWVSFED